MRGDNSANLEITRREKKANLNVLFAFFFTSAQVDQQYTAIMALHLHSLESSAAVGRGNGALWVCFGDWTLLGLHLLDALHSDFALDQVHDLSALI